MLESETCIIYAKEQFTVHSRSEIDPLEMLQVRCLGSENFLSVLTLKISPDKYDSNLEITFSENPMHPIF